MNRKLSDRLDSLQLALIRAKRAVTLMSSTDDNISSLAYDSALHHFTLASEELNQLRKKSDIKTFDDRIQRIVDLRNAAMHEYFRVDGDEIINSINLELEPLVQDLENYFQNI